MSEDNTLTPDRLKRLEDLYSSLVEKTIALETKQALLIEGLKWAANEVRPVYGMAYLGKVLDGIAARLAK